MSDACEPVNESVPALPVIVNKSSAPHTFTAIPLTSIVFAFVSPTTLIVVAYDPLLYRDETTPFKA